VAPVTHLAFREDMVVFRRLCESLGHYRFDNFTNSAEEGDGAIKTYSYYRICILTISSVNFIHAVSAGAEENTKKSQPTASNVSMHAEHSPEVEVSTPTFETGIDGKSYSVCSQ
jgi:hypothetical protein